ncbi:MAG: HAD family hydrolase [Paracoccaceae bacterium]
MARIKGVLLDKDGTLIDYVATWRGLVEEMISAYVGPDAALGDALGMAIGFDRRTGLFLAGSPVVAGTTAEVAALMSALLPRFSAAHIEDDANRRALAAGAGDEGGLTPTAGLAEALEQLRRMGLSLGVATHDTELAARAHMRAIGLYELFDFFAGYDSGYGTKPGPGMPQAFCAALALKPQEVVMVGDSLHDLGAGRAAGCAASVGVLTGLATEAELAPHADVILHSVADLPDYLRQRFPT